MELFPSFPATSQQIQGLMYVQCFSFVSRIRVVMMECEKA